MFETEKLIQEIQQRDILWNVNNKNYTNKVARRNAWEEIAAVLHHDWQTVTDKQKDERVAYFIKKWRNVRDYYKREKRRFSNNPLSSSGAKKKKKYYYYDSMTFLDAVQLNISRVSNSDSQELTNNTECLEDTSNDIVSNETCIIEEDSIDEHSIDEPSRCFKQEESMSPKAMPTFETHVLIPLDKSQEKELSVTANRNFLLSLLPDFTSLNERQNIKFRIGILNLLNDIKFGHK